MTLPPDLKLPPNPANRGSCRWTIRRIASAGSAIIAVALGLAVCVPQAATAAVEELLPALEIPAERLKRVTPAAQSEAVAAATEWRRFERERFKRALDERARETTTRFRLLGRDYRTLRVDVHPVGVTTWVGRPEDGKGLAILSFHGEAMNGTIETSATTYELQSFSEVAPGAVRVIDQAKAGATRFFTLQPDYLIPPPLGPAQRETPAQIEFALSLADSLGGDRRKAAPTPQVTIDVMVAYTPGMTSRHGSASGVLARLGVLVGYANAAYQTSEVAIKLRLVHALEVTYQDTGANADALHDITGSAGGPIGSHPIPPPLQAIAGLRDNFGADIVVLVRPFHQPSHMGCGTAWLGGYDLSDIGWYADFGYAVVSDGASTAGGGWFCATGTLAHEIGHNMGLLHDRANEPPGLLGATRYGFGYVISSTNRGDIMSYALSRFQAFSNPNLRCGSTETSCSVGGSGDVLGVAADGPTEACISSSSGCAPSQAAECTANPSTCADAARALNFTRVKVSQWRPTQVPETVTISGNATKSEGANVPNGTTVCASPATGVNCAAVSGGAYSCTVPSGWTGSLHLMAGNGRRVNALPFTSPVNGDITGQNFLSRPANAFPCNLDIDNNGLIEPSIDGAMLLRHLFGQTPGQVASVGGGACAQRATPGDLASFFSNQNYDFDGSGNGFSVAREGLVLLRLMLGVPGPQAVNGTGLNWATVQGQINAACGTNF
ncbi:MAG: M12 family metallo-peptidase [Casimicrobiaceae bacterium]|nr:M12 family metallo-peptidase [Casimicrobiaceae bacterium]